MDKDTVLVFTRCGMGDAPAELQQLLAARFLGLLDDASLGSAKILFYTDGVRLACAGSTLLE